jgi:hypothetical protein
MKLLCGVLLASVPLLTGSILIAAEPAAWPKEVKDALGRAGENRGELLKALEKTPERQRPGMVFLIANMPRRDLRGLSSKFLLENVDLAYKARAALPWGKTVPQELFLNDVLAYANLDEERHAWRKELFELCLPLVKDCKSPGEAAKKLNKTIFPQLKVRYSTKRKKANQSPKESMETGLASCSGLSILLVDACRSVCIPARVVGTPMWHNNRGNHTWVEVWDGRWRFTGAAEPAELDQGWFVHDASLATKDSPRHAIYAASFRRTAVHFPLVWDRQAQEVFAENVTDRYTAKKKPETAKVRVQIRVRRANSRERLALPLTVVDRAEKGNVCSATSRAETADTNDILSVELLPSREYVVRVGSPVRAEKVFKTTTAPNQLVEVEVPAGKPLSKEQTQDLEKEIDSFFKADAAKQAKWTFPKKLDALLLQNEAAVRQIAWQVYQRAGTDQAMRKDYADHQVRYRDHTSPYTVKTVGKKPAAGWPLFIAMHGGGGVPKEVNDSQWKIMQRYYKDQTGGPGYIYVALRAPNNTWNGFYDTYVPPLINNLIRQFGLLGEVDLNKVYLMGYSHGGYGAFYIGPRIPARFAAVHVSAAAPSDPNTIARNLRNTVFTFMVGEKDTAYGRITRCEAFDKEVQKLRKENKGEYPVTMELKRGFGHGGLPDRDKIKEMIAHRRVATPRHVTWEVMPGPIDHFFWLSVSKPASGQFIDAAIEGQTIRVTSTKVDRLELTLDSRLVPYRKPLKVVWNGKERSVTLEPSLRTLCASLAERGDPDLAGTAVVTLAAESK